MNSFNNSCNNSCNNDQLFFQIWKNEYIKLKILKFVPLLNKYNKSYSYYEATNLLWLLNNNHLPLIKDKLNKYKINKNNSNNNNIYSSNQIYFQVNKESLVLVGNILDNEIFESFIEYWYENHKVYNKDNNNNNSDVIVTEENDVESELNYGGAGECENEIIKMKSTIYFKNQQKHQIFNCKLSDFYILQGILKSKCGASRLEYYLNYSSLSNHQKELLKDILLKEFKWGEYEYKYYVSTSSLNYLIDQGYIALRNCDNGNKSSIEFKLELVKEILIKSEEIKEFDYQDYQNYYLELLLNNQLHGNEDRLFKLLKEIPNITINEIIYYQDKTNSLQSITNDNLIKELLHKLSKSTNIIETIAFISEIFGTERFKLLSKDFFPNYLYQLSKGCGIASNSERIVELLWYFYNNGFNINCPVFTSMVSFLGEYELLELIISNNFSNNIEHDKYLSSNALNLACLSGIPMLQIQQQEEDLGIELNVDLVLSKYFGHLIRVIESINQLPDDFNSPSNISVKLSKSSNELKEISISNYNYEKDIQYFIEESDQIMYRQYSNNCTNDDEFLKYFKVMELLVPYIIIDESNETLAMAAAIGGNPFIINYYLNSGNPNIDWLASTLCFLNQQDPFLHLFSIYRLSPDAYALCVNYSVYNCNSTIFKTLLDEPYYNTLDNIPHFHHLLLLPVLRGSLEMVKLLHEHYNQEILDTYILISILINSNNNNGTNNSNSVSESIKFAINNLEFKKRNKITKYLLRNKKFKKSNALEISCYKSNQELIDFILDEGYYNFEGTTIQDNIEIEILLANGSDIRIIEKILKLKLLYHHNQSYQLFQPYTFNIAFLNGHIKTGQLFLESKFIDWKINQIKSNHLSTLLFYLTGRNQSLSLEFILSDGSTNQELFNFYTSVSTIDFTLILSNLKTSSISILLQNFNRIVSKNDFKKITTTKSTNSSTVLNLNYYRHGHFLKNVIKLLISYGDLATLYRLASCTSNSSVLVFNKLFNKQLFMWSAKFENISIISFLYNISIIVNNNSNDNDNNSLINNSKKRNNNNRININNMHDDNWMDNNQKKRILDLSIDNLIQQYNQNIYLVLLFKSLKLNSYNQIIKKQKIN